MTKILRMIVLVVLVAFLGFQIQIPKMHEEPFENVLKTTINNVDLSQYEVMSNQKIRRFLNLDPNDFESIIFYRNNDPMQASEFVLVKFKDMNQSQSFEECMHDRIDSQIDIFEGYIDEEVSLLKKAVILVDGNYALYAVGDFTNTVQSQFLESIGE